MTQQQLIECTFCSLANAEKYLDSINATMEKYEINSPLRQAHYLAQIGHESLSLIYTAELADGSHYENRADLGNTHEGDGKRYKGRGFIQITGRFNYIAYGHSIDIDFENNPVLLADVPYCADSSGWFWQSHNLNIFADQNNIKEITRRINGGFNGLNDRETRLYNCKKTLGIL